MRMEQQRVSWPVAGEDQLRLKQAGSSPPYILGSSDEYPVKTVKKWKECQRGEKGGNSALPANACCRAQRANGQSRFQFPSLLANAESALLQSAAQIPPRAYTIADALRMLACLWPCLPEQVRFLVSSPTGLMQPTYMSMRQAPQRQKAERRY
jgi:hypothetical protein